MPLGLLVAYEVMCWSPAPEPVSSPAPPCARSSQVLSSTPAGSVQHSSAPASSVQHSSVPAGPNQLTFVSAGSIQFSTSRAPPDVRASRAPPDVRASRAPESPDPSWPPELSAPPLVPERELNKLNKCCKKYSIFPHLIIMCIYAFRRHFYPKRLSVHSGNTFFSQYMCSLGIKPTTFALLTQCSNH